MRKFVYLVAVVGVLFAVFTSVACDEGQEEAEGMCFFECANGVYVVSSASFRESDCTPDASLPSACDKVVDIAFVENCFECEECNPDWFPVNFCD